MRRVSGFQAERSAFSAGRFARPALLILGVALAAFGPARADVPRAVALFELGPEAFDGEAFVLLSPGIRVEYESLSVELAAPLRLRLNAARAHDLGLLRSQDWDSRADLGRVVREVGLVAYERALDLRLGALAHRDLGHGTIVSDFGNALDPDQLPVGFTGRVSTGAFVVEALASDVLDPGVLGAQIRVEPLSLFRAQPEDRLHATAALFSDWTAPRGDAPRVLIYGLGLDAIAWRSEHLKLAPYLDLNGRGGGFGLHLGVLADVSISSVDLSLKVEWRRAALPYQPEYFDLAYPIERSALRTIETETGAITEAKGELANGAGTGWRAETRARFANLSAGAALSQRVTGEHDASLVAALELDSLEIAALGAARAFAFGHNPQRFFAQLEARYRFSPFLHAWLAVGRVYRLHDGGAEPATQLGAGIGGAVALGEGNGSRH